MNIMFSKADSYLEISVTFSQCVGWIFHVQASKWYLAILDHAFHLETAIRLA